MTGRGKADCLSNLGNSKLEEEREGEGGPRTREKCRRQAGIFQVRQRTSVNHTGCPFAFHASFARYESICFVKILP